MHTVFSLTGYLQLRNCSL